MSTIFTHIIPINEPEAIPLALSVLERNDLIVFPTETLYGLAGRINDISLQKIYAAKQRPEEKAIPVLIGDLRQLDLLTAEIKPGVIALISTFWPGPLTLVLPKIEGLPHSLTPYPGLAIRMPDHPFALQFLRQSGPLAVTSANTSGGLNPTTAADVYAQLNGRVALILDGGVHPGGQASTVIDCQGDSPVLLREGPIRFEWIQNIWRSI